MKIIFSILFFLFVSSSFSQDNLLRLKSGNIDKEKLADVKSFLPEEVIENGFFRILSFKSIPTDDEKLILQDGGLKLLNYLPSNCFFAHISTLANLNEELFSQIEKSIFIDSKFKLSADLASKSYPHWSLFGESQIEINATYFESISLETIQKELLNFTVVELNDALKSVTLRVNILDLEEVFSHPAFYYFECIDPPGEPDNQPGRTSHRGNSLRTEYSGGQFFRGEGVTVMMQDDGRIGDHIDYEGRIDQSDCAGCSTDDVNNHGDHVAGTIMGAGNLDPKARGMADGVKLLVYSSSNTNYNVVPNLYNNDSLVITSKSYSDDCNGGYTSLTRQLDQQIRLFPSLIHVFSAGNSGGTNCGYGAGADWGNITGGHKSGKNVVCVGNLTNYDLLNSSSSVGPATDGRIKPDICGVGTSVFSTISDNDYDSFTGTSMSCPGVAGIFAQLYDAYRNDFGVNPNSGLIKACVLNTGEDLGNPGPDFKFGWGRINARRAYETFALNQFIFDSIDQGGNNLHNINVPSGTSELRIMVYWSDYEAAANASIALVNDINMIVTDPSIQSFEPWVLDPTPNSTSLNTNAVRAVDNLNNMEQVTIQSPQTGNYQISIDGFSIPQGPQDYHIVYYFVKDDITLTFPNGGEGLEPGSSETIRWDARLGVDNFTLEYTEDDGITWNSIGTVTNDKLYRNWLVPTTVSGQAKVRVSYNGLSDESDAVFSIIDVPNNLAFAWSCPDSSMISWTPVPGATSYEISALGIKYMDSIGTTTATSFTLQVPATDDNWYSVKAFGPNGAVGERAIAIQKTVGEFNCIWSAPYADFSALCTNAGENYCFNITEESINTDGTATYSWYFPGGTPATSTDQNPIVCYPFAGDYDVAMVVNNGVGSDSIYVSDYFHVSNSIGLPYLESFENYTTFNGIEEWAVDNPENNAKWSIVTNASLTGLKSAKLANFGQSGNFTDDLTSGVIDLSTLDPASDIMTLSFRYAYRKKLPANYECLKVFISNNCEETWSQRKTLCGAQLSPLSSNVAWTPSTPEDWTTVHMTNVTSAYFTSNFKMRFRFESDSGNNIYLENINIYEGAPSDELILSVEELNVSNLAIYPNPADNELNISYLIYSADHTSIKIIDPTGKCVLLRNIESEIGSNLVVIDTSSLAKGVYFVQIGESGLSEKVIIL